MESESNRQREQEENRPQREIEEVERNGPDLNRRRRIICSDLIAPATRSRPNWV
jgi:hypothetical protein